MDILKDLERPFLKIDHTEIERRKQFRRDLWDYKPVDHIPVFIWPTWYFGYLPRETIESGDIQFEINVRTIERCLRILPDDYIPWARIWCGYMTIATMFGMEVYWSDNPAQPPGIGTHIIHDMEQVFRLKCPGMDAGLMPENVRRLHEHIKKLPGDVYLTGIDAGGPLNTCKDLLDTNLLYTAFYDHPQAMHHLLNLATELQLGIYHTIIKTVGGIERMTGIDFDPIWAPEKYKSFVSDDVCATIGPQLFREFSLPYNSRLLQPWGSGLMHNCGPNPCKNLYLEHSPKLKGLNVAFKYSQKDFPAIREIFAGWGMIHIMLDNELAPEEMLSSFRYTMETLAPDVIGVPMCFVDDTWSDEDVIALYWEMRKISNEYATNMRWASP